MHGVKHSLDEWTIPTKQTSITLRYIVYDLRTHENAWALTRPPATYPCQYSCPIDLLIQTFHTLQQLIMTDRQRPFNYPNENDDLKVSDDITTWTWMIFCMLWRHDVTPWRHAVTSHDARQRCNLSLHDVWWGMSKWHRQESKNHVFQSDDLDPWPMTLTFKLIQDIINGDVHTKL